MKIKNKALAYATTMILACYTFPAHSADCTQNNSIYDLNLDGSSDLTDLTLFTQVLLGIIEPSDYSRFDLDNNKIVSRKDYDILRQYVMTH